MKIFAKRALLPDGWLRQCVVTVEGGRIVSLAPGLQGDVNADVLTPGLLDKHQHGAYGFDAAQPNEEACGRWLRALARRGVTAILYTIGTGPAEATRKALAFARQVMQAQKNGALPGARILGAHLEGPFINPARQGAMAEEYIQAPGIEAFNDLAGESADIVRAVTLAPEMPGADALIRHLVSRGIRVQAGHSDADAAQARSAFESGVTGTTHTFNAMPPVSARCPGLSVEALLNRRVYCEAICDLVHVDARMLQLLLRMKGVDRIALISDSVATAGLPDGRYEAGNHPVIVRGGRNFTESGGLAGGHLQLDAGVRNLVGLGVPRADAFAAASATPAASLGLQKELGRIAPGARACLAAWDEQLHPVFSICDGEMVS